MAALLDVGEAEFPVFLGLVDAGEEALALFCFGEVEEEFEDAGAVAVEVGFVVVDGGVAVGPDIGDGVGEALGAEETGVDAHDENLLVVGAIEDADLAAGGEVGLGAPEEVVGKFLGMGCLKLVTWQPCGLTPDMTWRMAPSLPAASMAWKMRRRAWRPEA